MTNKEIIEKVLKNDEMILDNGENEECPECSMPNGIYFQKKIVRKKLKKALKLADENHKKEIENRPLWTQNVPGRTQVNWDDKNKEFNLSENKKDFCEDDECTENSKAFDFHKKIIVYPKDKVKEFILRETDLIQQLQMGEIDTSDFWFERTKLIGDLK